MIGFIWRQGGHHSAQKSTRTGVSDWSTSSRKVASVTALALLMSPSESPGRAVVGGTRDGGGCGVVPHPGVELTTSGREATANRERTSLVRIP